MGKKNFSSEEFFFLSFFLILTFIFWFARFWRFEELMTFQSDQELFMRQISEMVTAGKPILIGPPVISKTVLGRTIFTGPAFYYVLTPLAILTGWDVVSMNKVLIGVWWLTGLLLLIWLGKCFGRWVGLAVYGIFAVFPDLVAYGRIIWNPNFLPLISVGFLMVWQSLVSRETNKKWFIMGFILGLGINFHYAAVLWLMIFLPLLLCQVYRKSLKNWRFGLLLMATGILLGDFPLVIFEIRHDFYNLQTIFFILRHRSESRGEIFAGSGHYLFPLVPVFFYFLAYSVAWLRSRFGRWKTAGLCLAIMAFLMARIDWYRPWGMGMPMGWSVEKQKRAAELICRQIKNTDLSFEIAATISGDTRAGDLRWWLKKTGCPPMGVEEYPKANYLFLIADEDRPPEKESVWEVQSISPFKVSQKQSLGDGIWLYRLDRL